MRVLVTGGTGFVGSHVAVALLAAGLNVCVLVRNEQKARQLYQSLGDKIPEIAVATVSDVVGVKQLLSQCDAVVHTAAITPMNSVSEAELFETNVNGVKNVVGQAYELGIKKIIYLSSISAIFHTDPRMMTDDAPVVNSAHPYGKSKAEAERYVRRLQENSPSGQSVISLYPGGIIGPQDPAMSASMMALCYRLTQGFRITSGGTQQIDVRDLAKIVLLLLTAETKARRFLTAGHYLPWGELADLVEKITGAPLNRIESSGAFLRLVGRAYDVMRMFKTVASPVSAETMRYATQWPKIENSAELTRLEFSYRPLRETLIDTISWLCQAGKIPATAAPMLQGKPKNNPDRDPNLDYTTI